MTLNKQYIKENLLLKNGNLNSTAMRKINKSVEEVYCIYHGVEPKKCICGKETSFVTFKLGYRDSCSIKCSHNKKNNVPLTKEYIKNNLIRENGQLESGKTKYFKESVEEIYCIYNDVTVKPKCICGKTANFKSFVLGYGKYCSRKCHYNSRVKEYNSDYEEYKHKVWSITNAQDLCTLKNYNKRGRLDLNPNSYHLDHRYSIFEGFMNNIPTYIIGNIKNLEMIPAGINCIKQSECSIGLDDLVNYILNR